MEGASLGRTVMGNPKRTPKEIFDKMHSEHFEDRVRHLTAMSSKDLRMNVHLKKFEDRGNRLEVISLSPLISVFISLTNISCKQQSAAEGMHTQRQVDTTAELTRRQQLLDRKREDARLMR